jgi:uncharacterized DUF497 family protein
MGEYKNWEESANQLMLKKHGVGIDDIPDMTWHEWFMDGWTIQEAVQEAIDITNKGDVETWFCTQGYV